MTPNRVLVVDDEQRIQNLLLATLNEAGFEAEAVATGAACFEASARDRPSVVILDQMLPDLPGTEVCRRLRADRGLDDAGIMILSARSDEHDGVLGLELGADDFMLKPFSVRELVLRVKGLARRSNDRRALARMTCAHPKTAKNDALDVGRPLSWRGLSIDHARHRAYADGVELPMRPLEYKLLAMLLDRPGVVLSRATLLEEVWGIRGNVNTRTVDTHVRRLREKLGAYGRAIETVHGFGYRLRDTEPRPLVGPLSP